MVECLSRCVALPRCVAWLPCVATSRRGGWLGALLGLMLFPSAAMADELWSTDLEVSIEKARAEGKSLLVDFTGSDWCVWCIRLDEEVFATDAFREGIKDRLVLVKLDYPRDTSAQTEEQRRKLADWAQRYAISGYPTILLLDGEGRPFAKTGYQQGGPEAYLKHLEELEAIRKRRDEAFAKAEGLMGVAKAQALDEALATIDPSFATVHYAAVIEAIGELDAEDEAGLRTKYFAARDRERQRELVARVELAARSLPVDRALQLIDETLGERRLPPEVRLEMLEFKLLILQREKRTEEQVAVMDQVLAIEGLPAEEQAKQFVRRAYALVAAGQVEAAIESLSERISGTLENRDLYLTRAELQVRVGRFEEALKDFDVVRRAASGEPEVLTRVASARAEALLELEREDEAIGAFDEVLRREDLNSSERADLLIEKAMILRELDRGAEAEKAEDEALEVTGDPKKKASLRAIIEQLREDDRTP